MPGMSGLDLQAKLNADHCPIPTIFITAHGEEDMRLQAMRGGAVKFMVKPFDCTILLESVRVALEGWTLIHVHCTVLGRMLLWARLRDYALTNVTTEIDTLIKLLA